MQGAFAMQKYLKKKIRDERGVYIAVYAKTPQELAQKVAERTTEIERRKQLAENPLVWQYAQTWYKLYTPRLSDSRKSDYAIAINKDNNDLLTKVNAALAELKADGTLQGIIDKYIK